MRCPQCHHQNLPDVNHCEACGFNIRTYQKELQERAERRKNFRLPAAPKPQFRGESAPLIAVSQTPTPRGKTSSQPSHLSNWSLRLTPDGILFPLEVGNNTIGRSDPNSFTRPSVDLTPYDTQKSVSRQHAKIHLQGPEGPVFLVDSNSSNGTFLNGNSLRPGIEQEIRAGSLVTFGSIRLELTDS